MDFIALLSSPGTEVQTVLDTSPHRAKRPRQPVSRAADHARLQVRPLHLLSPTESSELAESYKAGETITALAARFLVSRCTIHRHLDRNGLKRLPRQAKLSAKQITEAARLYRYGQSLTAVGQHFDVNATTIRATLRRAGYGVRLRPGWADRADPSRGAVEIV